MSAGQAILLIIAAGAVLAVLLIIWNSQQRKNAPAPSGQRRDLDLRIDQVISGARDASDRAVGLAASPDPASATPDWPAVRADMLAVEGDIVSLDVHVGEAPMGRSLAELARSVHALRDAVDRHVELRTDASDDEHALGLSQDTVSARRRDVDVALESVTATRP